MHLIARVSPGALQKCIQRNRVATRIRPAARFYVNKSSHTKGAITATNTTMADTQMEEGTDTGPIKYSTSPANEWRAADTRTGTRNTRPWFEPYVVTLSAAVFLVYFCYLREENGIDEELSEPLYNRVDGLEEVQLRMALKHHVSEGLDTAPIEKRLLELEDLKHRTSH